MALRRRAEGSRTGYKLVLVLAGMLISTLTFADSALFSFDSYFLKTITVFMLVVLLFELSVRLNHENIVIDYRNVGMFFAILITNILILGVLSSYLLIVSPIHAAILAIILSSIEYFLVDSLKSEGDLANPLIILFAFSIMVFYGLQDNIFENTIYFLKYIFIGLAMGVFSGIITFSILRYRKISFANELGMIAAAGTTYIVTDQLHGSGLFAIMILGIFFGNSHVRRTTEMKHFSPKIFKTLEMLIYLMIGFVVKLTFNNDLWWKSLILFGSYILLRFIVLSLYFKHDSFQNRLLLAFAPKGMILGIMILVFGVYGQVEQSLVTAMLFVLIYSLICGIIVEFYEQERDVKMDRMFKAMTQKRIVLKR